LKPDFSSQGKLLTDAEVGLVAVDQLRADADKGQADAQAELGIRFLFGNGVAKDYVEAVKWFRKAPEQGNPLAQADLGYCYVNGYGTKNAFGITDKFGGALIQKDVVWGYMWYNLAAAQGQKEAVQNLGILEKEMTPEQIAEGQRLSREFIPRPPPIQEFPDDTQPLTNKPAPRR
jgi:hypothetical protein